MSAGVRHPYWTSREIDIVRGMYPKGGIDACVPLLPKRSRASIYQQASKFGLRAPGAPNVRGRWPITPLIDARIIKAHQSAPTRGMINALAAVVGYPRWWVSRRARELGLVTPSFRDLPWSESEIELLHATAHLTLNVARKRFATSGFKRSEAAIQVKRKRIGTAPADNGFYPALQVARLLGVDVKMITRWIFLDGLKAERRGTARSAVQGGDMHFIKARDLRAFIIASPFKVDLRKIPRTNTAWFVELIGGRAADYDAREARTVLDAGNGEAA